MSSSSRWRGSSSLPPRPSLTPLLLVLSLVLAFGPLQVQAANETDAQNAQDTSERLKAAALLQGTDGGSGAIGFVWAACEFFELSTKGGGRGRASDES